MCKLSKSHHWRERAFSIWSSARRRWRPELQRASPVLLAGRRTQPPPRAKPESMRMKKTHGRGEMRQRWDATEMNTDDGGAEEDGGGGPVTRDRRDELRPRRGSSGLETKKNKSELKLVEVHSGLAKRVSEVAASWACAGAGDWSGLMNPLGKFHINDQSPERLGGAGCERRCGEEEKWLTGLFRFDPV